MDIALYRKVCKLTESEAIILRQVLDGFGKTYPTTILEIYIAKTGIIRRIPTLTISSLHTLTTHIYRMRNKVQLIDPEFTTKTKQQDGCRWLATVRANKIPDISSFI